ncbi:hypothetical protein SOVF_127920, partial [Spinacia oleracea]
EDGASGSTSDNSHELSFLGVGGGLLQVGLFPTVETVTVASTGGGSGGGGGYSSEYQQQVQVQEAEHLVDTTSNKQQLAVVAAPSGGRKAVEGFGQRTSIYRGVTRHHQHGRWQARIGRVAGNKDLYLGTFSTQEEAAEAYDIAAIKFRGLNAVTNFDISRYDVKSIISSNLPVGGMSNKSKSIPDHEEIKPLEGIKPELPPLIPTPHQSSTIYNHNFIGIPLRPDSSTQNYNWPALGQLENNEAALGYTSFGYVQQQQPGNNDGANTATEGYNGYLGISNNNDDDDNNNNNGDNGRDVNGCSISSSWSIVTPSLHSLQSPKQNVPVLQTPIFGIE